MEKFKSFITEEEKEQSYKLIIFNHSAEMVRDVKDTSLGELIKLLNDSAKKVDIEIYNVDFVGLYVSEKNGKKFLNSFPFTKSHNQKKMVSVQFSSCCLLKGPITS